MTTPYPPDPHADQGPATPGEPPALPPLPVLTYQPPGYSVGYDPFHSQVRDDEHLKLLALFHYITGGLMIAFSSIFIIHFVMGIVIIRNPNLMNAGVVAPAGTAAPPPPPAFMGWMFACMGGGAVLLGWTGGVLTIVSGGCIKRRRQRTFSLVVAGICCLWMPVGTILGIFTLMVLLRESVAARYAEAASHAGPAANPFTPARR